MIFWETASLHDREAIFEYLYAFNPEVAERTDALIQQKLAIFRTSQRWELCGRASLVAY